VGRAKTFRLDRQNGKLWGVCAGIANYTGWDATLVRVGVVLVTLIGAFPWTLVAYGAVALIAKDKRGGAEDAGSPSELRTSTYEMRESMTDFDRRIAEVESFVTAPNTRLAQEIESLR
jgi:phage shock protein C